MDPAWDAAQWQVDRFAITAKPTPAPSIAARLMGFFGGQDGKTQNTCQVDDCTADVASMKEYHSRYKICEPHLKAMLVIKDGRRQRFCQQCGKFHDVAAFDGSKRSCRDRLAKHNARRRRMREMQHMLRTTGTVDEAALQAKYGMSEDELGPKVQRMSREMSARSSLNSAASGSAPGTPVSAGGAYDNSLSSLFAGGAPGALPPADLALLNDSFLEDMLGPDSLAALPTSLPPGMGGPGKACGVTASFMSLDPGAVMDLDDMAMLEELTKEFGLNPNEAAVAAAGGAGLRAPGTGPRSDTSSVTGGAAPALAPRAAAQAAASFPFPMPGSFAPPPSASRQTVVTTGLGGLPPYMAPPPACPPRAPPAAQAPAARASALSTSSSIDSQAHASSSVLEEALNLLAYDHAAVRYAAEERLLRFSAKLFGCTPAQLPLDLKASLTDMLASDSMEGYMRPGCVHLEVDSMVGGAAAAALAARGLRAGAEALLASSPALAAAAHTVLLQLGGQVAVARGGKVIHVLDTSASTLLVPALAAVRPLAAALPARAPAAAAPAASSLDLQLWGYNLGGEDDSVLARSQGVHMEVEVLSLTADPAWEGGLQRLDVRVRGRFSPGSLQVEVLRGCCASAARTLVLAPSPEAAAEVRTLESAAADSGGVDALLYEVGAVLEAGAAGAAGAARLARAPAAPADAARRLLHFTVQRKWPAVSRAALDAAADARGAAEAAAQADVVAAGATGMPLLQLAVRTQSAEMVAVLLEWGASRGHVWRATTPARRGLTALHLAGLVCDGGAIAGMLTAACADAASGWDSARAEDGATPLELAARFGTADGVERILARAQYAAAASSSAVAATAAAAAKALALEADGPHLGKQRLAQGLDPVDDVAAAKAAARGEAVSRAAAMGPLLRFASPALESKYAGWFHTGQVPVDVAFMLIAILSQGAWVLRWDLAQSALLAWVMAALVTFNAVLLAAATVRRGAYVRHREAICVASLLAHKVAQLMVTALPGAGTIYSGSYNAVVALLESSSFAQVAMLSFGARARVAVHLPACAVMLLMSTAINGEVCAAAFPSVGPGTCAAAMAGFQAVACCALPCAGVYLAERRSRRTFLQTAVS